MRYTLLNKIRFIITRFTIIFFIIFMQNLYEKFYNNKKLINFLLNKIFDFSIN